MAGEGCEGREVGVRVFLSIPLSRSAFYEGRGRVEGFPINSPLPECFLRGERGRGEGF
jgi:hypothetical protein